MACAARLAGVSHRYGKQLALEDVSIDLPSGGLTGFIGPDGVGKSTALALLAGARRLQQGRAFALGGDLASARSRRSICPRIAYMPQGLGKNLYPTLSARENIDFFGRLFGLAPGPRAARIAELLDSTGLASFAARPVGQLSGGMKQKLGLCCALIHDPELLILDEPTTGVDPLARRQFWELIERMRARHPGMSVLVATAYMEEAERFDHLVAMDQGRVLATGTAAALRARTGEAALEDAFVALLPQARRRNHARLVILPRARDGVVAIEARGLTCRFGDFTAVDDVSLGIQRGEIFGFLGSNGCGKTTTMKMLTGLLAPTAGTASLFGRPLDAGDLETRKRVGYMSQSFSLYGELTVRQNLELHAHLFHLPRARLGPRGEEMHTRFELREHQDARPAGLPLGIRQRLQLAAAVIHAPQMLILDEPTSGVDPIARDRFWELLVELSRRDGVTVFISTHFMNEAERCDRVSLMHAGRVLAEGPPAQLAAARGAPTLEAAFISFLEEAEAREPAPAAAAPRALPEPPRAAAPHASAPPWFSLARLWAYARRETLDLRRDPVRLGFALGGPILLMIVFGYGINFDVDKLPFAVLDGDRTQESRAYLEAFESSPYFEERAPIATQEALEARLRSGELKVAIELPPSFGADLQARRRPDVGVWLDGAMPSRAEESRGYVEAVHQQYVERLFDRGGSARPKDPVLLAPRFRYNPEFRSVFAMVPGVIMLLMILIPAMMTAVGVVREKEIGSITNLYATPVSGPEFLVGKQLPYLAIALASFLCLLALAIFLFHVPIRGSGLALAAGALLYALGSTAFGLLISTFSSTQVSAIFAAGILTTVPAVSFSGMLAPPSALSGAGRALGRSFPSLYFQDVSLGAFTKALRFAELRFDLLALAVLAALFVAAACALLRTQER